MTRDIKNCLLCAYESYSHENFYWKCSNCELIFKDPSVFVSLEKEKARYATHNNSVEDEGYLSYLNRLFSLSEFKEGLALDYGCGPTKGLEALVKNKNLDKVQVESYDPLFFPIDLKHKKYDLIFASECLEHFHKPDEEVKKILNLLKSKGSLLISTELYDGKDFKNWWYLNDPTHVVFYSKKTFQWMIDFYGLSLVFLKSPHISLESK